MIVHVLHRGQRKKLRLSAEPGTIAAAAALVSRSGWGNLLTPYEGELTMEQRLEGLRFSFDKRTGAIVAADEGGHRHGASAHGHNQDYELKSTAGHSTPDDTQMSKLPLLDATTPLSSSFAAYQSAAGKEMWKDSPQGSK